MRIDPHDASQMLAWVDHRQALAERHGLHLHLTPKTRRGYVELNLVYVPSGRRRQGWGTAVMRDLVDAADAAGLVLAVTPFHDYGSSRAGLDRFFHRFGFTRNRGRYRDVTIAQVMIRSPR